ncbi:MAG TPA: hypothetical protein PL195_05770 [bacterium]|nr:hypothetical protein [bacterium]HQJ60217.1 hypothetical protein [bacterium]
MEKRKESRSDVQTKLELEIAKRLGLEKEEQFIGDIKLIFDGVKKKNEEVTEIYEIYCGIEKLKSAQKQKIANDLLKMLLFEKLKNKEFEKKIVVVDENIKDFLSKEKHKTWLNQVIDGFNVKIELYKISYEQRKEIKEAKKNQNLMQK